MVRTSEEARAASEAGFIEPGKGSAGLGEPSLGPGEVAARPAHLAAHTRCRGWAWVTRSVS